MEFPSGVTALMNPHAVQRDFGFNNRQEWHWFGHVQGVPKVVVGTPVKVNITPQGVYAHVMVDGVFALEKLLMHATADDRRQLKEWFRKRNIPCVNNLYELPW